ncbi:WD40 repeat domain-containing protein [Tuwongella immobilis]|uniref:Anaphase-promoting complex subunit 4 WD40 domain-containing protein n=1 Tax=Tuwongella immobilis TaxID=692036 RepID=A0A6C2YLG7_9BACT|nr:hypothetical protein [Tuwongella immobilis]VIP01945.1 nacht and wd domain protein : Uncharacterized protein OS=Pseudogymnoascus pannorum VKM F-103 GN=V499_07880 PE=4 SV=1: WD40: WD40 [Tuwongella immobilis]VTR99923.1 nacht and wd domain protein : Uncharacterized protein OS=Pseudogymnoascus pannorum VKM F-103 GN=V499_07880 PE=4 SV=1: WD40: WD40 [Tuwongella immobilis]
MLALNGHSGPVTRIAYFPEGDGVVSLADDGTIRTWAPPEEIRTLGPFPKRMRTLMVTPQRKLIYAGDDGTVSQVDLAPADAKPIRIPGLFAQITSLVNVDRLDAIAIGMGKVGTEQAGGIQFYCPSRPRALPPISEMRGVWHMAYCRERNLLVWATGSRELAIWELSRPDARRVRLNQGAAAVAISPDGTSIAVTEDRNIRIFDSQQRSERLILKGHQAAVRCVAFHPNGHLIATGSWDQTIRLWDVATGAERYQLKLPVGKVHSICFAPDGLSAAVGGGDGLFLWDTDQFV